MTEPSSRKEGFKKCRSATFSIDGYSFTIASDLKNGYYSCPHSYCFLRKQMALEGKGMQGSSSPEEVANETGDKNARPLSRFARSKSQNCLWNTIIGGLTGNLKERPKPTIISDPRPPEEILADELPPVDSPEALVDDLVRMVAELKEEVERLRDIRECEQEIDWWSDSLQGLKERHRAPPSQVPLHNRFEALELERPHLPFYKINKNINIQATSTPKHLTGTVAFPEQTSGV
ncbi:Calcium/calmodulin-dependent 3',5'-cyclic nucleotide phosphodiesterase 1C isoform X1 [Aix galericulata]|nr:Calcium/calmodulin-dependent 3',5'-cyclic nucleotide phosphodiesterase 1C isoform X1 [Aix galericulata]